jgi:hypothetical protein
MLRRLLSLAAVAVVSVASFGAEIKSGPQPGDKFPGPFHPLNVTGESKGEKACLVCKAGGAPVAMVFARCADCEMTAKLVKKLDEITAKNTSVDMNSFAVFLTDDTEVFSKKLEAQAKKSDLKHCTLAIDNPTGPEKYNVNKDAEVTVVLYVKRDIKASYAFKKGELTDAKIDEIVKDTAKILPAKK